MGASPYAPSRWPSAISCDARLAAHNNRPRLVSPSHVDARPVDSGVSISVAMIVGFSLSCAPPSAVAFQCHVHGAPHAIALAIGHLTRRASRRTQRSTQSVSSAREIAQLFLTRRIPTFQSRCSSISLLRAAECGDIAMGAAPYVPSRWPSAISRDARLAAHNNRPPLVSPSHVVARLVDSGVSISVAMIVDSLSCAPPSAVALQCHVYGAPHAIALAIGHLTRRSSHRTQQSVPMCLVRSHSRSTFVGSGGSIPVIAIVDFSLLRAAKCGDVSVPCARRLYEPPSRRPSGTRILGELVSACERTSVEYKHAGEPGKCAKESERVCRLILSNIRVI